MLKLYKTCFYRFVLWVIKKNKLLKRRKQNQLLKRCVYLTIWLRKFLSNKTMEKVQKCEVQKNYSLEKLLESVKFIKHIFKSKYTVHLMCK
jgi:hypothetical protein